MADPTPRHPASDPEIPEGLPARETKHEDDSVVGDLASDLANPSKAPTPAKPEPTTPPERRRTIRQRRSNSRSHWNLDQPDEPQKSPRGQGFGWIFGIAALSLTTLGGIVVFAMGGASKFISSSGPPRALQVALALLEQGELENARQYISATTPEQRNSPYFYSLATRMAIAHNDGTAASNYLEQGFALAPEDPLILIAKAELEFVAGDPDAAITTIEKAIAINPELNIAWRILGQAKFANKDIDGALEAFEKSLEIAPNSVATINSAVRLHMSLEDTEAAAQLFRKTLEARPNPNLSISFAGFLVQSGEDEAAADAIDQALMGNPSHALLLSFRAKLHLRAKNYSGAQETLRAATVAEPKNPQYWAELGSAYGADERFVDAGNAYKRSVELEPGNPATLNNLGYSLLAQQEYSEAEAYFVEILTFNPNNIFAHQNLAQLYEETFNEEKAKEHREKAEEIKAKAAQQQPPANAPE